MREFEDIGGFLRFMEGMPGRLTVATEAGLTEAAKIIQHEAKEEIGHYQGAAGPFAGWDELAASTQLERVRLGWTENDPLLRSGELRDHVKVSVGIGEAAIGVPNETVGDGSKANPARDIGHIAVWMENGTEKAPPRPFLGGAAVRKSHEAVDIAAGPLSTLSRVYLRSMLPSPIRTLLQVLALLSMRRWR